MESWGSLEGSSFQPSVERGVAGESQPPIQILYQWGIEHSAHRKDGVDETPRPWRGLPARSEIKKSQIEQDESITMIFASGHREY